VQEEGMGLPVAGRPEKKDSEKLLSLNIISQNVRGFRLSKECELFNRIKQRKIYAAVLQETWRCGNTTMKDPESGCVVLNHGPELKPCKRGALGVAVVLSPEAAIAWGRSGNKLVYFGERIICIRIQIEDEFEKTLRLFIVSAYAPDSSRPQIEKDNFTEQLQCCFDACDEEEIMIVGMDCNASIGIRSKHDEDNVGKDRVRGQYGVNYENIAGKELHALLGVNELAAATTFFKKRDYATWFHPASKKGHQIDHIIIRQRDMKRVIDAGFIGWRGVESDHQAVYIRLYVAKYLSKRRHGIKLGRIDRGRLLEEDTKQRFIDSVLTNVNALREERLDVVNNPTKISDLTILEKALQEASKEHLTSNSKAKPGWYKAHATVLEPLIRNRNTAQAAFNARPSDENKRRLHIARKMVKKEVLVAMKVWIESVVFDVNQLRIKGDITPKQAWDAVKLLKRGSDSKVPVPTMKFQKSDGTVTESPEEAAEIMIPYLKSTFSKVGKFDDEAVKRVPQRRNRPEMNKPPDFEEYKRALLKLNNNKAPGDDGNFAEL
jgi:hypothetical protein